ncbi:MAG: hypothetical protein HY300_14470, partial [Verrucomicrobia bacterium]|nr:hypothetical protein [Verrucomicrobiota bacterium]
MAGDYIPPADVDFDPWQNQCVGYITTNKTTLGVSDAELAPITAAKTTWDTAYPAHVSADATAQSATQTKKDTRDGYEAALRPLIQRLQSSTTVTDAQRRDMKITVRSTARTPAAVPTTKPAATVDTKALATPPPVA